MTCQEVVDLMQRYLDQDLNEAELVILQDHLDGCPDCPSIFERMKLLSNELAALPKVTPPYSLVDRIMPQLEKLEQAEYADEADDSRTNWVNRMAQSAYVRTIGGIAAAALILIIVLNNMPFGSSNVSHNTAMDAAISGQANATLDTNEETANITSLTISKHEAFNDDYVIQDHKGTTEPELENNEFTVMEMHRGFSLQEQGHVSPNEQYTVIVNQDGLEHQIIIVDQSGDEIYASRVFEADLVSNIQWADDSKVVFYETILGEAVSQSQINVDY